MRAPSLVVAVALMSAVGLAKEGTPIDPALRLADPGTVRINGIIGDRIDRNRTGRLTHIPMDEILSGFRRRPGRHPWIGEHLGKWLHAAVHAWQYSADRGLKAAIDHAVREVLGTQEPDGYLGTYLEKDRWTSWDVWVHKYNCIGLLTYYAATSDEAALRGARRIGDLLNATFGPGKRDIIRAGTHVGMAATSVLEPMVALYRASGDPRHLQFCRYLVTSWDQPHGPRILSSLSEHGKVNRTANGKAYEMMSNLVGLCDLYQVTGEKRFLEAARIAWEDIAAHQVYVTGGTSLGEHFQPDGHLPDTGAVAETCANVTWLQLCLRLAAITGETRYVEAAERVIYNHLVAAQADDGNDWCYFTALRGRKAFRSEVNCCHSSGPRGVALIPTVFYGRTKEGVRVNLYGPSRFRTEVPAAGSVEVIQKTSYPAEGRVDITFQCARPARFPLELRIPSWSATWSVAVDGVPLSLPNDPVVVLDRAWKSVNRITLELDTRPRWIVGEGEHKGMLACARGPFVLCASRRWNETIPPIATLGIEKGALRDVSGSAAGVRPAERALLVSASGTRWNGKELAEYELRLGPYALVQKEEFAVWLPSAATLKQRPFSLLFGGREYYSRRGNVEGSITDSDARTYRVTFDGTRQERDVWEVTLDHPVEIRRVVFHHGHTFHDGGWFDTSSGKPEVFVQTDRGGAWKRVGELNSYPSLQPDTAPRLADGAPFALAIKPRQVYGLRVTGKPACGDNPTQAFSSCGELAAY